jgi:hypothetical protein
MSSEYDNYIARQTAIFSPEDLERQKQEDDHKLVYNDLLARFHLLQESLKDEQQKVEDLKSIVMDYMNVISSFKERIVEVPFFKLHTMFLLQARPSSLFLCVDENNRLKWVKAPEEMNDHR